MPSQAIKPSSHLPHPPTHPVHRTTHPTGKTEMSWLCKCIATSVRYHTNRGPHTNPTLTYTSPSPKLSPEP